MARINFTGSGSEVIFEVKVRPGAREPGFRGEFDGAVKIDLKAPPEDGRANEELIKLIASRLNIGRNCVEIISGFGSRRKRIKVASGDRESVIGTIDGAAAESGKTKK
ncbi:MAG TPA: DUF167 domain-containing protein [bacterium]|nr:DUF167 domain-containing protein [bacterium]